MKKRMILILGIVALCILTVMPAAIFASDDRYGYEFELLGDHFNSYSSKRERQTKSTQNPWKVSLDYSEEGDGTIATFWLSTHTGHVQASDTHNVTQGTGPKYYSAWSKANQTFVCLSAENNNNTFFSKRISGTWDEETW